MREKLIESKKKDIGDIEELRTRLEEAEETLRAIRSGEVDAIVVSSENGEQIFTLQGAEHPYRVMVEAMEEGAATLLPDGTILYCNRRLAIMLKAPLESLIGTSFFRFILSDDMKTLAALLEGEGNGDGKREVSLRCDDGSRLRVQLAVSTLQVGDLQILCVVAIDLTRQKQAEERLKETLAQLSKKNQYDAIINNISRSVHQSINLQEVLENAVDSLSKYIDVAKHVAIYLVEGEAAVMRSYRGHPEWFIERVGTIPYPKGFTWKTIIGGKPIYCPDVDKDIVIGPAGREVGTKSYVSMPIRYAGKTVGSINVHSFHKDAFSEEELNLLDTVAQHIEMAISNAKHAEELRKVKEELELRVQERTLELVAINEQLKKENIERKRAEERLTLYREVFDKSIDGIGIIDPQGCYIEQNPAHRLLVGYSDEELYGKTPAVHLGEEVFSSLCRELATSGKYRGELVSRTKNGTSVPIDVSAFVVSDDKNEPTFYVGIKRDITNRKIAEEQLGTIYSLRDAVERAETVEQVYEETLNALGHALKADRASVLLFDQDGIMRFKAWRGLSDAYRNQVEGHSPWSANACYPEPILIPNVDQADLGSIRDIVLGEGIRALAFIPLVYQGRLIGKFMIYFDKPHLFTDNEVQLVQTIAAHIGHSIERKRAEEKVKVALEEKEILLREIHHRVKNNLQIISSLIKLQSKSIDDETIREKLKESQNRVKSMAIIHERLYESVNLAAIDFKRYTKHLVQDLFRSYGAGPNIRIKTDMNSLLLNIDKAVPLGLILNELISNSLKHAFPNGRKGEIQISLHQDNDGNCNLIASDNGAGLPSHVDFRDTKSLGLQLVTALTKQIKGNIKLDTSNGTKFSLTFNP